MFAVEVSQIKGVNPDLKEPDLTYVRVQVVRCRSKFGISKDETI